MTDPFSIEKDRKEQLIHLTMNVTQKHFKEKIDRGVTLTIKTLHIPREKTWIKSAVTGKDSNYYNWMMSQNNRCLRAFYIPECLCKFNFEVLF